MPRGRWFRTLLSVVYTGIICGSGLFAGDGHWSESGRFSWQVSRPLLTVNPARLPPAPEGEWIAIKDPSVVRHNDEWHLFCTLRRNLGGAGRIRIGYLRFSDWPDAVDADWSLLELTDDYHGAPQIFYYEPHHLWYLIYQATDESRDLPYGPCFSVNRDLANPQGWTRPSPLYSVEEGQKAGLDFWVISDDDHAHLLYTSLDGCIRHRKTTRDQFPHGPWSAPRVVYRGNIFEASHTYRITDLPLYLTIVEAQDGPRRYYQALTAPNPEGPWKPLATDKQHPFVSPRNVLNQAESWATSYSHGEILRSDCSEFMRIPQNQLRMLFQGVDDVSRRNRNYGQIPWQLGLLTQDPPNSLGRTED